MKRSSWIACLLSLALLWPGFAWPQGEDQVGRQIGENYTIEIEGRMWNVKLDSTVKVVENGIGTDVKLVDDLGFEERKNFFEGRLQVKFARKHKFNLEYIPLKWDADKILTKTIQFSGQAYTAGTRVQSSLDLKFFKGGYEYDFLVGSSGFLGGTLDVLVANGNIQLKAPDLAIDQKEDKTVPIPMIGLIGRVYPIKWVNLTAKASGLPLGSYGYVFDAEASLNINPIRYLGISGGYRYFSADLKYNDNSLNYRLDGPFVGVDLRF